MGSEAPTPAAKESPRARYRTPDSSREGVGVGVGIGVLVGMGVGVAVGLGVRVEVDVGFGVGVGVSVGVGENVGVATGVSVGVEPVQPTPNIAARRSIVGIRNRIMGLTPQLQKPIHIGDIDTGDRPDCQIDEWFHCTDVNNGNC